MLLCLEAWSGCWQRGGERAGARAEGQREEDCPSQSLGCRDAVMGAGAASHSVTRASLGEDPRPWLYTPSFSRWDLRPKPFPEARAQLPTPQPTRVPKHSSILLEAGLLVPNPSQAVSKTTSANLRVPRLAVSVPHPHIRGTVLYSLPWPLHIPSSFLSSALPLQHAQKHPLSESTAIPIMSYLDPRRLLSAPLPTAFFRFLRPRWPLPQGFCTARNLCLELETSYIGLIS